jgi:ATP-dependent Clp protease ATP-binding subunit ClpB
MLQILDEGRLTDGQGRTVDFKNTILIMTSNISSHRILEYSGASEGSEYTAMKNTVMEDLRAQFRPEFLNRVDETIVFHALAEEHLTKIVRLQLGFLKERLAERSLSLNLSDAALQFLVRVGHDPAYGARPLKRAIQKELENRIGVLILEGSLRDGDRLEVEFDSGEQRLRFHVVTQPDQESRAAVQVESD